MQLPLASYAYARAHGAMRSRLLNLTTEASPQGPAQDQRIPRPGLLSAFNWGTGPIRGLFRKAGSFGGAPFAVSGRQLFVGGVLAGPIPGTDQVRFAASGTQMVMVSAGLAYLYQGGVLAQITSENLPLVSDVTYFGDRFLYCVLGSDRNYYSELNDAANIGGLNFFTSEASADPEVAVQVLNDEVYFFGSETVEIWSLSNDHNAPFQRNTGSIYEKGCLARDSVAAPIDNALFWIGDDRSVYRSQAAPLRVSSHAVEDALRRCADIARCTAWGEVVDTHALYVLNVIGIATFALDIQSGGWAEWSSYGRANFRGHVALHIAGNTYVGDDATNDVWILDPTRFTDGGEPIERIVSTFYATNQRFERCDRLSLVCTKGEGTQAGAGSNPVVEMRFSDDQCETFSRWRSGKTGRLGAYSTRTVWRQLGKMHAPGRYFEFRCSDPVLTVFQAAFLNEAGA